MSNPTTRAQERWQIKNGDDYLQLVDQFGSILSWIDSTGSPQGNLATGRAPVQPFTSLMVDVQNSTYAPTAPITFYGTGSGNLFNALVEINVPNFSSRNLVFSNQAALAVNPNTASNIRIFDNGTFFFGCLDTYGNVSGFDSITATATNVGAFRITATGSFAILIDMAAGSLFPSNNNTQDLGQSGYKWNNLWLAGSVGFFGTAPATQQTVTGVKLPSDTVMASLLSALAAYGIIVDSTT